MHLFFKFVWLYNKKGRSPAHSMCEDFIMKKYRIDTELISSFDNNSIKKEN